MSMKILYCNKYNFPFSGTEVYLFDLMNMMQEQGHEVALFSMRDPRGKPTAFDDYFVPVHRLQRRGSLFAAACTSGGPCHLFAGRAAANRRVD
jgi:hypothetical protein